jgi:hypothetical protein
MSIECNGRSRCVCVCLCLCLSHWNKRTRVDGAEQCETDVFMYVPSLFTNDQPRPGTTCVGRVRRTTMFISLVDVVPSFVGYVCLSLFDSNVKYEH